MRKGFTIVEMLAVVAIIAILATIITTAASSTIKSGRKKRAVVMQSALAQAISAYYAQEGKWPSLIEQVDTDGEDSETFTGTKADQIFREVVGKGFGRSGAKSMLVDASALFVCEAGAASSGRAYGIDFSEATAKGAKRKISFSEMAFGYQDPETGRFRRFSITYNCRTDSVVLGPTFE